MNKEKLRKIKKITERYKNYNVKLIEHLTDLIIDNETLHREIETHKGIITEKENEKEEISSCVVSAQKELDNNEIMLEKCNKIKSYYLRQIRKTDKNESDKNEHYTR